LIKEDFWNEQERAKRVLQEKRRLEDVIFTWNSLNTSVDELADLFEMAREEDDEITLRDIRNDIRGLEELVRKEELTLMMTGEHDGGNAIMTIHAGAGGTEAQDWAEMLLRMYLRWAEGRGYRTLIVDFQPGDEAGIKSATLTLEGPYAFGYARAEAGIHRLVRISPFDTGRRRHTSFASVFVYPELEEDNDIEIDENDLRIDTYRSSGAGGQHVNKTDSAVRITHLPTGIVVQCQNERSQHKNKSTAMKILASRLYDLQRQEQNEKNEEVNRSKKDISWGSQIRSYVVHPYRMVKDHRTNMEVGDVDSVLDGSINEFIEAYLASQAVVQP
jgi:peptide chain release factor 2